MEYFRATFFSQNVFFFTKNVGAVVISACIYTFDVDIFATAFFTRRELLFFCTKKYDGTYIYSVIKYTSNTKILL